MSGSYQFAEWFMRATGHEPYPFQIRFADGDWLRNAVPVPGHTRLEEGEGRGKGGLRGEGLLLMCRLGWERPRWRCWGGCVGIVALPV